MKTKTFLLLFVLLPMAMIFTSCEEDRDVSPLYNGLVTIRYTESEVLYFQLDDVRTLYPVNMNAGKLFGIWKRPGGDSEGLGYGG